MLQMALFTSFIRVERCNGVCNATFSQALCSHFGVESVILPSGNYLLTRSGSGSYGYIDIHAIIEE